MHAPIRPHLDYALAYARQGWRVFPLHEIHSGDCSCGRTICSWAGKHPRTLHGVKDATTNPAQIRDWWANWPTANIGVATGLAEGASSGLYVIDVDIAKGADLDSLAHCDLSELLCSLIARTGSGGYHIYLSTDRRLPNTINRLAPFVDTRGENGYVVAPPSRNRYGAYTWEARNAIIPMPEATLLALKFPDILPVRASQPEISTQETPASTRVPGAYIITEVIEEKDTLREEPALPAQTAEAPAEVRTETSAAPAASAQTAASAETAAEAQASVSAQKVAGEKTRAAAGAAEETAPAVRAAEASTGARTARADAGAPADEADAEALAKLAKEVRDRYLLNMGGRLRGHGLNAAEICAILVTLNEVRYGAGRHPKGPLALEEMKRTIFKSVEKWQVELGLRNGQMPVIEHLSDLMNREIPPQVWIVPELLCEGLVILSGKPKLGKSWLVLDLALAVARGSDALALGRYPVTQAGVLYLSLEDSPGRFQKRVGKLLGERPVPANFDYALNWKPLLAGGLADLRTALEAAPETRLVVIDTLARVRTAGSGGNVYQEDYALMGSLQSLALEHHVTLLLVHHLRKMASDDPFDMMNGSIGLPGGADTGFILTRERGQHDATLHSTGRDLGEQELALTFNPDTCTWRVTGTAADRQVSQSRKEVLDLLEQNGAMTPAEIARELEKPRPTIKTMLRRMTKEGTIMSTGSGQYMLPSSKQSEEE